MRRSLIEQLRIGLGILTLFVLGLVLGLVFGELNRHGRAERREQVKALKGLRVRQDEKAPTQRRGPLGVVGGTLGTSTPDQSCGFSRRTTEVMLRTEASGDVLARMPRACAYASGADKPTQRFFGVAFGPAPICLARALSKIN